MAESTLEKMARGGVYDQLAGGFHRYSVDERWLVPHFEKMTYDNSELLRNYLHGWQVTQNPLFRETAEGIIALGQRRYFPTRSMAAFTPARTPIIRSTMTAIISPGRLTRCALP